MQTQSITIAELVAIPTLHATVLAGAGGLERQVLWAHSCELENPWLWLTPGDLLMTVGFCVPRDPAAQQQFVRELHGAGVVGAMLGQRQKQLRLSPEMLAEADRLGFPLLHVAHEVPWSAISRHVAAASSSNHTSEVLTLAKLYELAATHDSPALLADGIAQLLGVTLRVELQPSGITVFDSARELTNPEVRTRSHRLSTRHAATLIIGESPAARLSGMVLVHLKRVLEVETDRLLFRLQAELHSASKALDALLLEGDSRHIAETLRGAEGDPRANYRMVAFNRAAAKQLSRELALREIAAVVTANDSAGIMLLPATSLIAVQSIMAARHLVAGVSSRANGWNDARGALAEALSALVDAQHGEIPWLEFAGARVSVLARSAREAQEIIAQVLGPLAQPGSKMATLRETLFCFMREERSWVRTATLLGIHRQTLAYRLRKVETLTGRTIAKTEDLAALWIALQAWERFGPESLTSAR